MQVKRQRQRDADTETERQRFVGIMVTHFC